MATASSPGTEASRPPDSSPRLIDASGVDDARAEALIHALAQLPDYVRLRLPGDHADGDRLELLARSYAIDERVRFEGRSQDAPPLAVPPTMAELVYALSEPGDAPASCRRRDEIFDGERIAFVTNLPAPYRVALLGAMSRRLTRAGAGFRVFFTGTRARGRPWVGAGLDYDFDHESLASFALPVRRRPPLLPLDLERRLAAFDPTIVLAAGFSPLVAGRAARYARRRCAAFGLFSGEIAQRSTSRSRLRRLQRERLVRHSDFAIAYGHRAAEYLRRLGPDLPYVYGRNTSDAFAVERRRPARPDTVELLAVADMASRGKGIDLLVDALTASPQLACGLTVVGPGAREAGLERLAAGDERIRFVGALPQSAVRERYGSSDVFLFPSTAQADVFGLALVEAMGSGLAPVISSEPGAAADLAVDGWNCLVVRERTRRAWCEALERIVNDHALRAALAENAVSTIRCRWTMEHSCDAFVAGLRLGLLVRASEGSA